MSDSNSKIPPSTPADPRPMIRLDDFMKAAGMVGTGGEAKVRIQAGEVIVNNEVETRRRRQLHSGDKVNWNSELWIVELTDDEENDQAGNEPNLS